MTLTGRRPAPAPASLLLGWDHIEFWVGNARQAAQFFCSGLGFDIVAVGGPDTGLTDRASYVLAQGDIRFVVAGPRRPTSPIAVHQREHGDGVHDLAFATTDAETAYAAALERGAVGLRPPWKETDEHGTVVRATIATYGDTQHTFVERTGYAGAFAPGYVAERLPPWPAGPPVGLQRIEGAVANVDKCALDDWVDFYVSVLGFDHRVDEGTGRAVVSAGQGDRIVLAINEPAAPHFEVEEYLDFYGCSGVQHVGLRTNDITATASALRQRGIRLRPMPPPHGDDTGTIRADRDDDGPFLAASTESITDRPTMFIDVVQRGSRARQ